MNPTAVQSQLTEGRPLDGLSASQALALLDAAVRINFREELLGKLRGVGGALQGTLTATVATR